MEIKIKIKECSDCSHSNHTGAFTKGGAKPCCNHPCTVKQKGADCFKRIIPYKSIYNETWKGDINIARRIPSWCPLKNGSNY